jgi:hypothetical protein
VQPFGLSVHDIFDLLDDAAIQRRFPQWPGHRAAREAFEASNETKLKVFNERQYGIPVHEVAYFAEIADLQRGHPPAELVAVVEELERYALDAVLS